MHGLLAPDERSERHSDNARRASRHEHRDPPAHDQEHNGPADNHHAGEEAKQEPHQPGEPDRPDADPVKRAHVILDLGPDASLAEIKGAYRRLAHRYHPDHNPGYTRQAAHRFADIQAVYQTLTDTSRERR